MNFKKFDTSDNQWHDTPYYQHKTATDTLTLPATLYPNDTSITVGVKGNTVQNGTPSPSQPCDVNGTAEKTSNLANLYGISKRALSLDFTTTDNMRIVIDGTKSSGVNVIPIKYPNIVVPAGTYTVKIKMTGGTITGITDGVYFGINQSTYGQRTTPGIKQVGDVGTRTFTLSSDTTVTSFDIAPSYGSEGAVFDNATFECQFYAGSDDKDYEPYGYKIPISSASTTTPVYLGEVETTRRVKKLVLTGEEIILRDREREGSWRFFTDKLISAKGSTGICSHFENIGTNDVNNSDNIGFSIFNNAQFGCRCPKSLADTVTNFKAYLAAQYAAGTPVTVWYVLANEETAVVNEPLQKIGDYADTVSNISIPVTVGGDTLSVGTTVQPSEVTVNYKGWHPVADVHERDNGAWT
jgi:hypothetical protein